MRDLFISFIKREVVKNASIVISGTMVSQILTLITAPLLTRIYTPRDYGVLAVYIVITTLVGTVATLQYQNAILTAREENEARKVVSLCLTLAFVFSSVLLLLVVLFSGLIGDWVNNKEVSNWLYFTPISVFFSALNTAFTYYGNRHKAYKDITFNRIITAIMIPIVSISLGLSFAGEHGLIIGLIVGQVLPAILIYSKFQKKFNLKLSFSSSSLSEIFKRHKAFPLFTLPTEFINNFINQLPILLLGRYFGVSIVGQYNLSNRILGMPVQLISGSIGEIFRQKAASQFAEQGNCYDIFKKIALLNLVVSLIVFIPLLFLAPALFSWVFGENWNNAGIITQILIPLFVFRFTVSPLTYMYIIAGKQLEDLLVHICMLGLIVFVFVLSRSLDKNYQQTLMYYSLIYSISYFYYFFRSVRFSRGIIKF